MTIHSRFYNLRRPGVVWNSPRRSLPERIITPAGESLERVNLPNVSLCADFLTTPENVWAGVAFAVRRIDLPSVWMMFEKCSPQMVRLVEPERANRVTRYASFNDLGWIEVLWLEVTEVNLVEVQTNEVLWYATSSESENAPKIVLLGLEDLENLANEPEQPLIMPWG